MLLLLLVLLGTMGAGVMAVVIAAAIKMRSHACPLGRACPPGVVVAVRDLDPIPSTPDLFLIY